MENEPCTLYELEPQPAEHPAPIVPTEKPGAPGENTTESDSEAPSAPSPADSARAEIERMIGEMGAEKVIGIIRANRNEAIEQIKSELQAGSATQISSGRSVAKSFDSLFDLASQA
ncbi:MAG: hypothetical protein K2K93_03125 [Muribaculaceae bacterium]|nr:hypothetical protein [Muribaculaceae bacterium]